MKKKWITKSDIAKILKTYSVRKDEFHFAGESGYLFQSNFVTGYTIKIEQETLKGEITVKTNRIMVTHSQSNGRKTYVDIWERDQGENLQFRFRNLWNQPPADADYIKDLEIQIEKLRQAGRDLQEQLLEKQKIVDKSTPIPHSANFDHELECEIIQIKESYNVLKKENQKLINDIAAKTKHNARNAGRKPSQERLDAISQVKLLLDSGCSDQDIMNQLGISRATYYRYKKVLMQQLNKF